VECLKVNENTCSAQCPTNYNPSLSSTGSTCVVAECSNRVPVGGTCVMSGDSALCYLSLELNKCYSQCPSFTTVNTTVANNPKCDSVLCQTRTPDSRGLCSIEDTERCYSYQGSCYSECPGITSPLPNQNVSFFFFFDVILIFCVVECSSLYSCYKWFFSGNGGGEEVMIFLYHIVFD
jgi:hypothetical protein